MVFTASGDFGDPLDPLKSTPGPGLAQKRLWRRLGELWEGLEELWEGLEEVWECLEELCEALYMTK